MKKLKLLIIAFMLFAINASANNFDPIKPTDELRAELIQLIHLQCDYLSLKDKDCSAEILFTINSHNEIVVISVSSPNPKAEKHLASKLNYKKIIPNGYKQGVLFLLPIKIVKEQ